MSTYAPCPNCKGRESKRVAFTWWGGAVGPAILSHVKCPACGTSYNGNTGDYNTTAIAVYTGVCVAIGLGIVVGLQMLRLL